MKQWIKLSILVMSTVSLSLLSLPVSAQGVDISQMLINLSSSLGDIEWMLRGGAYLMGLIFFFKALYHLKIYGELRTMMASHASFKEPLTYLIAGSMLMFFPTARDLLIESSFGTNSITAYSDWHGGETNRTMQAIFMMIQLVGIISFIRGWMLIAKAAGQGGGQMGYGKGIVHLLGAVMAMNIVGTANLISDTLGINF